MSAERSLIEAHMKFSYTHHMPYTGGCKSGQDWPVANKQFDAEQGMRIFRAGIDSKVFAEECGFDWIGSNEHHMSPYGLMPNPNLIGACVAERTNKAMILVRIWMDSMMAGSMESS